jgi:transposase-like protein
MDGIQNVPIEIKQYIQQLEEENRLLKQDVIQLEQQMHILQERVTQLEKIVVHKNFFKRNKKDIKTKILGVFLYHRALSYRDASKILSIIKPASYEAVRYWYNQFKELFVVGCKDRRTIAIDETKVKREGKQVYLWTAIDADSKEIIAIYISDTRCSLDTYWFLKKVS